MIIVNNRDKLEWYKGMTVSDVLDRMHYHFSLITVEVNGELVPNEDYDDYEVPDGAHLTAFHLGHGS